MSGPLWTGPLHDGYYVTEMLKLAEEWGWTSAGNKDVDLEKLLNQMIDESDPELPFGYIKLDEVSILSFHASALNIQYFLSYPIRGLNIQYF